MSRVRQFLRRLLARVSVVAAAILVTLLLAELLVRLFGLEPPQLMLRDSYLGQTYRPGLQTTVFDEEAQRTIAVSINSRGFRDVEHAAAPAGNTRRVVMLGDSFQAALSVDAADSFSRMSERVLNDTGTGAGWEVISMAVAGFGTAQELLAYERYGRADRPRVVVLNFFAGNDVSDNSAELSTSMRPYYRLENGQLILSRPSESRRKLSTWFNDHSRLYVWQKRVTQKLERMIKRNVVVDPVMKVFMAQPEPALDRAWAVTEALIAELGRQVEADGARLLVSYIPFSDEVNADWWDETVRESPSLASLTWDVTGPSRRLSQFCARNGIAFVSVREAFKHAGGDRFYFKHGHFNERGHAEYAKFLAGEVLRLDAGR